MKNVISSLLLIIVLASYPAFAADIVEVDVVVDSNVLIEHFYTPDLPPVLPESVHERIVIDVPSVVLSPGDIYRIKVRFTNSMSLEVVNGAEEFTIMGGIATGSTGGSRVTGTSDGYAELDITSSLNMTSSQYRKRVIKYGPIMTYKWYAVVDEFQQSFKFERIAGEFVDGSLLSAFWFEITVPTVVDGVPWTVRTYSDNKIFLDISMDLPGGDKNLWAFVGPTHQNCIERPLHDTNGDCKFDWLDLASIMNEWLNCGFAIQDDC